MFNAISRLSLRISLPLVISLVAIIAAISTGATGYLISKNTLTEAANTKLAALVQSRKNTLQLYLNSIEQDLVIQAQNPAIADMLTAFSTSWEEIGEGQKDVLQSLYITQNAHPTGEKDKLYDAGDGSSYSLNHAPDCCLQ